MFDHPRIVCYRDFSKSDLPTEIFTENVSFIHPHIQTGWATLPGDAGKLAEVINECVSDPVASAAIAHAGHLEAIDRFHIDKTMREIDRLLVQFVSE